MKEVNKKVSSSEELTETPMLFRIKSSLFSFLGELVYLCLFYKKWIYSVKEDD